MTLFFPSCPWHDIKSWQEAYENTSSVECVLLLNLPPHIENSIVSSSIHPEGATASFWSPWHMRVIHSISPILQCYSRWEFHTQIIPYYWLLPVNWKDTKLQYKGHVEWRLTKVHSVCNVMVLTSASQERLPSAMVYYYYAW